MKEHIQGTYVGMFKWSVAITVNEAFFEKLIINSDCISQKSVLDVLWGLAVRESI